MCGIVGAVAQRNILPNLIDGLKRPEYRGYDSCGVALYQAGKLVRARSVDRVAHLQDVITKEALSGYTGIAHTRWATHGKPVTANAHPQFSPGAETPRIALSHNGIIEVHANGLFCLQSARLSSLISSGNHGTSPRNSERVAVCKSVRWGRLRRLLRHE
jgi:glucosamine 6-phosphate synthetase-like amidotransferase/phosphosugar isomerase protein